MPEQPENRGAVKNKLKLVLMIRQMIVGGAESQMVSLIKTLDRSRYDIHLCLFTNNCVQRELIEAEGVPITVIPKRVKFDFLHLFRLTTWLARLRPDIVHTWITEANSVGSVAALLCRVPVRIGYVLNVNFWKTRPRLFYDRFAMGSCHCLATNSLRINRFLIERMGISPGKLRLLYNGVDPRRNGLEGDRREEARVAVRKEYGIPLENRVFVTVAGMRRFKNHLRYLEWIAMMPENRRYTYFFVGEGELFEAVKEKRDRLGLAASVVMAGVRFDIPRVLAASDIMVMPSIIEGLPNAILEGMAAGLPVVATDVGGIPEAVDHGRTGFVVPPEDGEALVRAMTRLGEDPGLCREMGNAGRAGITGEFTHLGMGSGFSMLYEEWHARCSGQQPGKRAE